MMQAQVGCVMNVSYHSYRDTVAVAVDSCINGFKFVKLHGPALVPKSFWLQRGEVQVLIKNGAMVSSGRNEDQ